MQYIHNSWLGFGVSPFGESRKVLKSPLGWASVQVPKSRKSEKSKSTCRTVQKLEKSTSIEKSEIIKV